MFTTLSRFRRQVAVLSVLALMGSVLVAAPVAAADPKMDYKATFDACAGVDSADFTDVPASHANAGDIDCIAYYGITKGTSATTYSPTVSVNREQMALFLTRLAGLVGIDVASDPDDAGFTDIGELSAESQTAINQLADLGITKGTSATTYSPSDAVKRGHMALFVARLMDHMDPMAEDSDTVFGYTPEKVVDVADGDDADDLPDKTVKSPFTDIEEVTKDAYDAITALWELGVASGPNATSYAPDAEITRASMAEFMAGVLDHSNARPAGVTIQAAKTSDFGPYDTKVVVSYRDEMFMPMVDVSVKVFHSGSDGSEDGVGAFDEDGGCEAASDCAWTDDEDMTDASGNIFLDGGVTDGKKNTYYAWMGDPDADNNDFDVDTSPHVTVTLSSTTDAVNLKVTTDINENAVDNAVDLDVTRSVTLTAQLVDGKGNAVAKSGVTVNIAVVHSTRDGTSPLFPAPAPMKTDADGKITYTIRGPRSTTGTDTARSDTVTFTSDVNGDAADNAGDPAETVAASILWRDQDPNLVSGSGVGSTPPYALLSNQGKVTFRATVSVYDQYGNPSGHNQKVRISADDTAGDVDPADDDPAVLVSVNSRGMASWNATADSTLGATITVSYLFWKADFTGSLTDVYATGEVSTEFVGTLKGARTGVPVFAPTEVAVVRHADDDSTLAATEITAVYAKENRFRITDADATPAVGALYTYDSGDTFINAIDGHDDEGKRITLDQFEGLIKPGTVDEEAGTVEIVFYDNDGVSIFRVTEAGS